MAGNARSVTSHTNAATTDLFFFLAGVFSIVVKSIMLWILHARPGGAAWWRILYLISSARLGMGVGMGLVPVCSTSDWRQPRLERTIDIFCCKTVVRL